MLVGQHLAYLVRAFAVHGHGKDAIYNCRGFRVNDPLVLVVRRFDIAVGRAAGGMFSGKVLCLICRSDLLRGVAGVPLVEQIPERHNVVVTVDGVHAVIQSNFP